MSVLARSLLEKIESRRARTGVVGLGYVGLPLAVELARAGYHATGIDLDQRKVDAIMAGRSYIPDVSTADVQALRASGKIDATTSTHVATMSHPTAVVNHQVRGTRSGLTPDLMG